MLAWIGVALLSVSWLVGLGYYHAANWPAWIAAVTAGTACLMTLSVRLPSARDAAVALLLSVPACVVAPLPYQGAWILFALGLALGWLSVAFFGPLRRSDEADGTPVRKAAVAPLAGLRRLSTAALFAGCILIVQSVGLEVYMACTARSHELPGVLAHVLAAVVKALGVDSSLYGTTLSAFSMRKIHDLGATWELLVDPVTWCFLLGGLALMVCTRAFPSARDADDAEAGRADPWRAVGLTLAFVLPVLVWLPFRAGLLVTLYLHEALRVDYDTPLQVMQRFWSTPTHLLLLAGPVLLAWRLVPLRASRSGADRPVGEEARAAGKTDALEPPRGPCPLWLRVTATLGAAAGAALVTVGILWDPVGSRKEGRVVIEEYHPEGDKQWERTDRPFDTTWYGHLSGYNYYCIYDYMTRFYDVVRRTEPLNEAVLENCDVLIVKVPTRPYSNLEIAAIERFVQRGGGLMLVGEHTNVFGSGTYLNSITRRFGFSFRYDCLFGVDKVFREHFIAPEVPHPIIQNVPWMDFAISCSIDPERSSGRAVMRNIGLKNLMADYHASNYYPKPDDSPDMRYGAFVQLWSMRFGQGRIAAFTDSTIFSNFCAFETGKKELWMGMVEWLNHRSPAVDPRRPLTLAGVALVLIGLLAVRRWRGGGLVLLAAGAIGWVVSASAVRSYGSVAMPYPEPLRPFVQVNMDRTVCTARLPIDGFISVDNTDYGIFDRWILRLGYFTARARTVEEALDGNLILFLEPNREISPDYRARLVRFVEGGGKILVIDSPRSARQHYQKPAIVVSDDEGGDTSDGEPPEKSASREPTANQLLEPFGMSIDDAKVVGGTLVSSEGWPSVPVKGAAVVRGGRPFAWVGDEPVGASVSVGGKGGTVTVVGFGARFRDDQMGGTGDVEPAQSGDKTLLHVYDWQFGLLRAIVEGKPLGMTPR